MGNLRIQSVNALDNLEIEVIFTDKLHLGINTSNISIESQTVGVSDPTVLQISIKEKTILIKTQPLTAFAVYFIIFRSTEQAPFISLNGDNVLLEDDINNRQYLIGPTENSNPVKEYLLNYLRPNVYDIEDGSIINDYLNTLTNIFSTALYDIRQARNDNYLSISIIDEKKIRGTSGFDLLQELQVI